MVVDQLSTTFAALSDPTRRGMIQLAAAGMTAAAIGRHVLAADLPAADHKAEGTDGGPAVHLVSMDTRSLHHQSLRQQSSEGEPYLIGHGRCHVRLSV